MNLQVKQPVRTVSGDMGRIVAVCVSIPFVGDDLVAVSTLYRGVLYFAPHELTAC